MKPLYSDHEVRMPGSLFPQELPQRDGRHLWLIGNKSSSTRLHANLNLQMMAGVPTIFQLYSYIENEAAFCESQKWNKAFHQA